MNEQFTDEQLRGLGTVLMKKEELTAQMLSKIQEFRRGVEGELARRERKAARANGRPISASEKYARRAELYDRIKSLEGEIAALHERYIASRERERERLQKELDTL